MIKCKCGGKVIFEGGYKKSYISVVTYRCVSCNTLYEIIENINIRGMEIEKNYLY